MSASNSVDSCRVVQLWHTAPQYQYHKWHKHASSPYNNNTAALIILYTIRVDRCIYIIRRTLATCITTKHSQTLPHSKQRIIISVIGLSIEYTLPYTHTHADKYRIIGTLDVSPALTRSSSHCVVESRSELLRTRVFMPRWTICKGISIPMRGREGGIS